jgi:sucrose phosphorylase
MSAESEWFARFLAGDPEFADFFHTRREGADYSRVVRPRTSPLFTEFSSHRGPVDVWTTFSADQVDLNFANPRVLLAGLDVLLTYARRGAAFIRLDAIGLLWKEVGTTCMHLPETHAVIQLWRACLDETYPDVLLLTETNVPHAENISYFGDGSVPEGQMVYQFPLAPLVLDAFRTGDATALTEWAASLELTVPGTTYFNFLASHDGVGVRPLEGIADPAAVDGLAALTVEAGGRVSYRTGPDGADIPYELNSTWFDLMAAGFDVDAAVQRHLGSHAIQLALRGIPGIYVHSLFGSPNDHALFAETGRARSLNRHKFTDPPDISGRVFGGMRGMVERRGADPAFHPDSPQRILDLPPRLFGIERTSASGSARVIVNLTDEPIEYDVAGHGRVIGPFETIWDRFETI